MDPEFSVDYGELVVGTNTNTNVTYKPQTGDSSIVIYLTTGVLALVGLITARKFD